MTMAVMITLVRMTTTVMLIIISSNYCSKDNDGSNSAMAAMATVYHRRHRSVSDDNDLPSMAAVFQQPQRPFSSGSGSSWVGELPVS